jgi:hypothetical protein
MIGKLTGEVAQVFAGGAVVDAVKAGAKAAKTAKAIEEIGEAGSKLEKAEEAMKEASNIERAGDRIYKADRAAADTRVPCGCPSPVRWCSRTAAINGSKISVPATLSWPITIRPIPMVVRK